MDHEEIEDLDISSLDINSNSNGYLLILGVFLIISIFAIWFKRQRKKKIPAEIDEADKVLHLIKKEGGRMTQKDIRKTLIMSEAKLSLIVTELMHKNKIEKIKKGRKNIIILKKSKPF